MYMDCQKENGDLFIDYHKGFSRPEFEDFDFDLTKEGKNIWAKLRYL